jgi:hypothetical protein
LDSERLRVGTDVSDCIDKWLQTSLWCATLRRLCDEPRQFDSYMTHVALALATPQVVDRFGEDGAGDILSAAAMPYFTRYFRGTRDQELAADSLAKTVGIQEQLSKGAPSVAASRDYCAYLDSVLWAFLLPPDEGLKPHLVTSLQSELVQLERELLKTLEAGS